MSFKTKVQLVTFLGGIEEKVAVVDVPKFSSAPDVLMWGNRVFVPHRMHGTNVPHYKEAFAYSVPEVLQNGCVG